MSAMSGGRIRLWYDGRGDFLEVMFEDTGEEVQLMT
jgi:hypothetical protein